MPSTGSVRLVIEINAHEDFDPEIVYPSISNVFASRQDFSVRADAVECLKYAAVKLKEY